MKQSWIRVGLVSLTLIAQTACSSNPQPQVQAEPAATGGSSAVQDDEAGKDETDAPGEDAASATISREQQCKQLIEVINAEQDTVRNATTDDAPAMRALAEKLTKITEQVRAVKVDDLMLQDFQQRYVKLIGDFADTARFTAGAMESKDLDKLMEAQGRLKKIGPAESNLVNEINQSCGQ